MFAFSGQFYCCWLQCSLFSYLRNMLQPPESMFHITIIMKPCLYIFQKKFEDRPTDNTTYKDASRRLYTRSKWFINTGPFWEGHGRYFKVWYLGWNSRFPFCNNVQSIWCFRHHKLYTKVKLLQRSLKLSTLLPSKEKRMN